VSSYRTVAPSRGAAWLVEGVRGLRREPGAYLGACLLVAAAAAVPGVGLLLGPVFYGGLLALLHTRAQGGPGHPLQAFAGFAFPALARLLPIASFNLIFVFLVVAVVGGAVEPELAAIAKASEAGIQPTPEQLSALMTKMAPSLLSMLPLAAFVSWMLMLAIPRAMLGGVSGLRALREAAGAVWVNLVAFVVNFLCLLVLSMLFLVVARVLLAPGAGTGLDLLGLVVLTTLALAAYCAQMYEAARDIFVAPEAQAEAPPPVEFEA
jgi:hypothetical protein